VEIVSTQPPFAESSSALGDMLSPQPALAAVRRLCVRPVDKTRFESVVRRYYIMLRCVSGIDGCGVTVSNSDDDFALDDQVLADQAFLLLGFGIRVPTTRDVRDVLYGGGGHGGLAPPGRMRLVSDGIAGHQQK
jgi:hypothetical protein